MASHKSFQAQPPFPDDIPTASMSTISLASLNSGDEAAARGLLTACQELGFFLLDLNGDTLGSKLMEDIDQLFLVGKEVMNLPWPVKEQYLHDAPRSFLGCVSHFLYSPAHSTCCWFVSLTYIRKFQTTRWFKNRDR
jgi:isopenicillin N synthase-like dioxygenase